MATVTNSVQYGILTASDTDEMSRLLGEVFATGDPPAIAVGLTVPEFEAFVQLYCEKAVAEGLTIIARSTETGEMIGALLTEDSASAAPDGLDQLSAKFNPIFDILGQIDGEYRAHHPLHGGEAMHLFLLGVDKRCAGMGLAQGLVTECLSNGMTKGYRRAVTEATNKTSQYVFRKLGFAERVHRSYSEHRFEGQACFLSIAEQGGPILMDRDLDTGH